MPAEAWRVHTCLHADAEETELRAAESGARAVDEWNRGHDVHSWGRPQFAGALDCADSRWPREDRKSTRLNSSHGYISYAVFCLKKKKKTNQHRRSPDSSRGVGRRRPDRGTGAARGRGAIAADEYAVERPAQ